MGRMQALGIAWDSRPKDKGGQRWFHLYPDQNLRAGNSLHWTGLDQTWNFMCAECQSTELRKNYDAAKNTYATTWAEIDVASHVAWAERQKSWLPWRKGGDDGLTVHFDERKDVSWTIDPGTGNARRSAPRTSAKELETCGMCHSRSAKIPEGYNYAPFRQSKMFMQGVSCSDCHDPHSLKLRADGNAVCQQCQAGQKYAAVSHHHHTEGSPVARCVACHMPARTYMVVNPRHDHAFRIPRPDESVRFGTFNACIDCHTDKDAAWAAAAAERWFGLERKGFQTWTETFAAACANANALLLKLATSSDAPSIARATAFESLAEHPTREAVAAAQRGLVAGRLDGAAPDRRSRHGAGRRLVQLHCRATLGRAAIKNILDPSPPMEAMSEVKRQRLTNEYLAAIQGLDRGERDALIDLLHFQKMPRWVLSAVAGRRLRPRELAERTITLAALAKLTRQWDAYHHGAPRPVRPRPMLVAAE